MDWRETFLRNFGPGLMGGISFADWLRLLRRENFDIDLSRFHRVVGITLQSVKNSMIRRRERQRFDHLWKDVAVAPPIFVLGHWRSGTTLLHQLLAQDRRFAFPTTYQVSSPHTFLSTEERDTRVLSFFLPRRRPMDNMEMNLAAPQEDEFALCAMTFMSPCMAWIFPRHRAKFEKYLTFRDADRDEIAEWQRSFVWFVRKLSWKHRRPLILKSPPHTARVRLLREMFPDAKFVHIHRDPRVVFQSTRRTFGMMFDWHGVQRFDGTGLEDWIVRQYREMYEAFFEDCKLIPSGHLYELGYEELEKDPVSQVRRIYEALALPDFACVENDLRSYVQSLAGYEKNVFPELGAELKTRIATEWKFCFDRWNYRID